MSYSSESPSPLLKATAAFVFLTIFDNTVTILDVPFIRNPAGILGILILISYLIKNSFSLPLISGPQKWALVFLSAELLIEFSHLLLDGISANAAGSFLRIMQWAQATVLFIIVSDLFRDPRSFRLVSKGFLAAICFMAFCTLLSVPYFTSVGFDRYGERQGFLGLNLNQQAFLYGLTVASMVWYIVNSRSLMQPRSLAAQGLALIATYLMFKTGSRSAFLVTIAGSSYIAARSLSSRNISAYIVALPVVVGIGVWLFFETEILQRRLVGAIENQSFSSRDKYFWLCWELFLDQPLFGYGTKAAFLIGEGVGRDGARGSHNGVFQILLTFGIVGFIVYSIFLIQIMRQLFKVRSTEVGILLSGLFFTSILYHMFADMAFNKYYWLLLGLAANVGAWHRVQSRYSSNHSRFNRSVPDNYRSFGKFGPQVASSNHQLHGRHLL